MSVVELFLRATAHPKLWGLKFLSCCIKSELSIRAMSAKCRSHRIWFLNLKEIRFRNFAFKAENEFDVHLLALFWLGPDRFMPQLLHLRHSSWQWLFSYKLGVSAKYNKKSRKFKTQNSKRRPGEILILSYTLMNIQGITEIMNIENDVTHRD